MSNETRRVLDLLAQGKITVDEADQLLRALATPHPDASSADRNGGEARPRYLRIAVHKAGNEWRADKDVNIRVPLSILRSGMRLGALIPGAVGKQVSERLRERGFDVDLTRLDYAQIETLLKNLGELTIDVDDGRSQVRIGCE